MTYTATTCMTSDPLRIRSDSLQKFSNRFPEDARICVTRLGNETVAAAFLLGFRGTLEVAWASSYRKFLKLKPNMFLYWNLLSFGAEHGYQFLDFGRSGRDSGTYDFKMQWGAVPSNLHWGYWLNHKAAMPTTREHGMQLASRMWQKLPVAITNVLGPRTRRTHSRGIGLFTMQNSRQCIFSVDVEDWFHILDVAAAPDIACWSRLPSRVEANFLRLLDLFSEEGRQVTCFFLGWIAERFPQLVREAVARGHEIASHGYAHRLRIQIDAK